MLVFFDRCQVDRAQALDTRLGLFQRLLGALFAVVGFERGKHALQVVTVGQQLLLQGLAPHIQALALQTQLLQLTA
ncbi:hypothetical protein D3C76_589190 [compost metagenome]